LDGLIHVLHLINHHTTVSITVCHIVIKASKRHFSGRHSIIIRLDFSNIKKNEKKKEYYEITYFVVDFPFGLTGITYQNPFQKGKKKLEFLNSIN
jgi:hypothetical protein